MVACGLFARGAPSVVGERATRSTCAPTTLTPSHFAGAGGGSELAVVLSRLEALDVKTEALKSGQEALKSGQEALAGSVKLIAYASTHATSERSDTLIKGGALFYVTNGEGGQALFCGFFVSESVALTINHDPMFEEMPPPLIHGFSSSTPPRPLKFDVVSTDKLLDFTVLRLQGEPSSAFFSLQEHSVDLVAGMHFTLVTMGIGRTRTLMETPTLSMHRTSITSVSASHIVYDASTWPGDSGSGLLFDEGFVIGMHQEIVDDKPERPPPPRVANLAARLADLESSLETVSEAASSHGKAGRALLLSQEAVLKAVNAAR